MAEVFTYMKPFEKKAIDFLKQRMDEIDKEMERLADERALYDEMLRRLDPCPDCNGIGEIRIVIDQDESEYQKCAPCKGTGVRGGNVK
jgi:hypothetical protein